jgi:2-amino-4-hydroxy-6-hydroxymethyldihydropteridine diphosphokinase
MPRAYVSVGSNVDPVENVREAVRALAERFGPLRVSPVYESRAFGFEGGDFLNLVVGFDTAETPEAIDAALKAIEAARGRERKGPRFSDRTLDLDLVVYGDSIQTLGPRTLPRPEVLEHAHVLRPLADIAGEDRHPVDGRRYRDIWSAFDSTGQALWPVAVELEAAG